MNKEVLSFWRRHKAREKNKSEASTAAEQLNVASVCSKREKQQDVEGT